MMNKTDLINKVAKQAELPKKDAELAVESVFQSISEALSAGEKVSIQGFGSFEVRKRAAREGRNPQTNETIQIPESKIPAFKPGKALKEKVQ